MISDNIRNYRKANNLSQDELAEKLGVSRQSISLWENGQTQPTLDNIIALLRLQKYFMSHRMRCFPPNLRRPFPSLPKAHRRRRSGKSSL